ncbi:hypothetical protein OQA88_5100 [Cercophora sp. LCS_1]
MDPSWSDEEVESIVQWVLGERTSYDDFTRHFLEKFPPQSGLAWESFKELSLCRRCENFMTNIGGRPLRKYPIIDKVKTSGNQGCR